MDDADLAAEWTDIWLDATIRRHVGRPSGAGARPVPLACETCGEAIEAARRLAMPEALRCVGCQELLEKRPLRC